MKFSNILFLCLVVLLALISCSDAGKKNKGVGRGGKKGGKNNGVRKFKGGKKNGGRRTRKNKNDDNDDDEDKKSKKKRKSKKSKKASKKSKKFGKSTRKGGSDEDSLRKKGKGKKKSKGCRHPDGADRISGHLLTQKVSGAVPCYKIACEQQKNKFKWMYVEQKCKTCEVGGVQYMVGYVSEQKCYGPPPCHIMMCMEDGQFRKQGWPCEDHTFFGETTTAAGTTYHKRHYYKATFTSKTYKTGYSDTSSADFKSLDSSICSSIKSAGMKDYHTCKVTKAYKGSTAVKGYVECRGTGTECTTSDVTSAIKTAGGTSVEASSASYTTTSAAATTVG